MEKRDPIKPRSNSNKFTNNQETLIISTWNIRRGLIVREIELKNMLNDEKIDIMFVTETDTKTLENEKSYQVEGYNTIFPQRKNADSKVRIICLAKINLYARIKIRRDLMSGDFPSIWLELSNGIHKSLLIAGFYRQWSHENLSKAEAEQNGVTIITNQIEAASNEKKDLLIVGDVNLCSKKWKEPNYLNKKIANQLINCLQQNGIVSEIVGTTFMADHMQTNGDTIESNIDHVYASKSVSQRISKIRTLDNSSSDHYPVLVNYQAGRDVTNNNKNSYKKKITKRSLKIFSDDKWNEILNKKDWSKLDDTQNLDDMVVAFTNMVTESLDEIAPIKSFMVKSKYIFGLSQETKDLMKQRDNARKQLSLVSKEQREIWLSKYKKLRNLVNCKVRQESRDYNNNRIDKANDENEAWKITNDIINPNKEINWSMKTNEGDGSIETQDKLVIGNSFNKFFVSKIQNLKDNIDQTLVEDPNVRLRKAVENKKHSFSIKCTDEKTLLTTFKKLKKKKSSGCDGLTQFQLAAGAPNLTKPLVKIFNKSITEGEFPKSWKEAVVTPILKKGDKSLKENYRPVSCLPAAAKLLELLVCNQTTDYMEKNNLLPKSQHGFRSQRSTMSALSEVQQQWALNTEAKEITGILLWDLSAAFDCLDSQILCEKLELYGVTKNSVDWFRSFLTNRTQRVRIDDVLSDLENLLSGVPQGGILSPLLYIIYVADIQLWLKYVKATTYADDTSTSVSHNLLSKVISMLEEDAKNVLAFMASNGLVANASKTALIIMNNGLYKIKDESKVPITIRIGNYTVIQEPNTKLLGVILDEDQKWNTQISKLISSLNSRLYLVKRLSNYISKDRLKKIADSLYMSKLRYGIQLYGNVRVSRDDPENKQLGNIQVAQNKYARFLHGANISDKIKTEIIYKELKILSVNQMMAQIKLQEIWKSQHSETYPIKWVTRNDITHDRRTRASTENVLIETYGGKTLNGTFINDAAKIWNRAPVDIKESTSLYAAKKNIKKFVRSLPI
jgi:hypothetical protein